MINNPQTFKQPHQQTIAYHLINQSLTISKQIIISKNHYGTAGQQITIPTNHYSATGSITILTNHINHQSSSQQIITTQLGNLTNSHSNQAKQFTKIKSSQQFKQKPIIATQKTSLQAKTISTLFNPKPMDPFQTTNHNPSSINHYI